MNKAPCYQWYPEKFLSDTRRLSWKSKGIYRELLDTIWIQYQSRCSIADIDEFIAHEIGATFDDWMEAKKEIMNPHRPLLEIVQKNGAKFLFSKGLWKEFQKQERWRIKSSEGGRRSAESKKESKKNDHLNNKIQWDTNHTTDLVTTKPQHSVSVSVSNLARDSVSLQSSNLDKKLYNQSERVGENGKTVSTLPSDLENFLDGLKNNPAYAGINFEIELGKADAWLSLPKNKYRKKTKQFLLNWLNKADRELPRGTENDIDGFAERMRAKGVKDGSR